MSSVAEETAFEKLLRPLGSEMSLEVVTAIARMKVDAETQARYETVARKASESTLSQSERDELESLVHANTILGIVKAEAQLRLSQK
jgi:hypothetical protein